MSETKQLSAIITYGDSKVEFTGTPELVLRSIIEYVTKVVPNLELARSILLSYGLTDLINMFKDYIKITPEGPRVFAENKKVSDKEKIMLQLVASRIAFLAGKQDSELMSVSEIQNVTGLNPKTISSRLSELLKEACVEREELNKITKYKITTLGVTKLNDLLIKKQS